MKNILTNSLVVVLFTIMIFAFLHFTGTLDSGFHFTDNHMMLEIKTFINDTSFIDATKHYLEGDFNIRFRPLYIIFLVTEIAVIGPNFFALSVFTGLLGVLAFSAFYFGSRKLNFSVLESILLVFLIFLGPQAVLWWKLGANETIGIVCLSLAFFFMACCINKENSKINNILFVLSLVVSTLTKESFIIVIPAFILFKVLKEKTNFNISLLQSIKNNWLSIFPMLAVGIELYIIKFVIGTNKIGYAGLTSSFSEFMKGVNNILFNKDSILYLIILIGIIFFIFVVSLLLQKEKDRIERLKSLLPSILFSLLIILPNIFMYAKSGMNERYLIPATLGFAFLAVSMIQLTSIDKLKYVGVFVITVFLTMFYSTTENMARTFAYEGNITKAFLTDITQNAKDTSSILMVVDPVVEFEFSTSLRIYLTYYGYKNIYAYPQRSVPNTDFDKLLTDTWLYWFKDNQLEHIKGKPDLIVFIHTFYVNPDEFFTKNKKLNGYTSVSDAVKSAGSLVYVLKEK